MNTNETAAVLAFMASAWPHANVSEATATLWAEQLVGVEPEVGLEAARRLVRSSEWFPSIATFVKETSAVKRAQEPEYREITSGPRTPADREQVARFLALCRKTLAERDKRQHWHGGPDPCVVCGGLSPKALEAARKRRDKTNDAEVG